MLKRRRGGFPDGSPPRRAGVLPIAILATLLLLPAGPCLALDWLVFVIDRSSSIDPEELQLQRQAYVDALRDPQVLRSLRHTRIAIVEFDSTAETVVPFAPPLAAARIYQDWEWQDARGGTAIGRGLSEALRLLQGRPGRRVVDISGDGRDNRDSALLERMRASAGAAGIEVNGLVIGGRTRYPVDEYYRTRVANGFVMRIDSIGDFREALRRKILREVMIALR